MEKAISDCQQLDHPDQFESYQIEVDAIFDRADIAELSKKVMAESEQAIDKDYDEMMK